MKNLQRNRTAAGEGYRKEHVCHVETDYYATKGTIGKMDEDDKVTLNVIRSGSTWTANTGYWAGHKESAMCRLCGKEKETSEHIHWYCEKLHEQRCQADKEIGLCNPDMLPQAIKHGIAPAMGSDPRQPFWGEAPDPTWIKQR